MYSRQEMQRGRLGEWMAHSRIGSLDRDGNDGDYMYCTLL